MSNLDQLKSLAVAIALVAACAAMVWNSPASASATEAFAMESAAPVSPQLLDPSHHREKHKDQGDASKRSAAKAPN